MQIYYSMFFRRENLTVKHKIRNFVSEIPDERRKNK